MNNNEQYIIQCEKLIKQFDESFNILGAEERILFLLQACDYVEHDSANEIGIDNLNRSRSLLAYILANKLYDFGYVLSLRSDYTTQLIELSFTRALQIAKYGYEPNDRRLQRFIDPMISISEQKGDIKFVSKLKDDIASLTK